MLRTAALLGLLSVLVCLPTLRNEFIWDDHEQVVDNPRLRSAEAFAGFWREDVLHFSRGGLTHSNYYRPLFLLLYYGLYQAFGASSLAWHACAAVVYVATTLAAFLLLRRLVLPAGLASAAAALFAVHPARGESVAWVAAAFNDPPVAVLCLLGLAAHVSAIHARSARWLGLGALAYALALGFKESALSMLLLVPLVEWWSAPQRHGAASWSEALPGMAGRYAPYVVLTGLYFIARALLLGSALGVYTEPRGLLGVLPTLPLLALYYVRLLAWPWGLGPTYPLRFVAGWGEPAAWLALAGLAALALGLGLLARRHPVVGLGSLWCAACVLPAFNIRSFRPTYLVHQRYLYLATLGFCLVLAWAIAAALARPKQRMALLAACVALFTASSAYHARFWASDTALWQRTTELDPANPAAFDWLGAKAMREGRLDEAEGLFRRSIQADPSSPQGACNLATLLHVRRHRPAEALPLYERSLAAFRDAGQLSTPRELECRLNYGAALAELGRRREALDLFETMAALPPFPPEAARNAAILSAQDGRLDHARAILEAALSRRPGEPLLSRMLEQLRRSPPPTVASPRP